MRIVYFTHSLVSCWNHGNAHFLRGLLRELQRRGHEVRALEPESGWSRSHLAGELGADPGARFRSRFPDLPLPRTYRPRSDVEQMVDGADLVIVHEWTEPWLVAALGRIKARGSAHFTLLFHDTHHRAASSPDDIHRLDLSGYDGVLAFGASLAEIYRRGGWGRRVHVFHEAADTSLFAPPTEPAPPRRGTVWIGNWGDGERSAELATFLLRPAREARVALDVFGVRYPDEARAALAEAGAAYRGWIANDEVPAAFARYAFTVHVPRRYYATALPGIPTIRVFEALACGLPLVSAPWTDSEGLFRAGRDFLVVWSGQEMTRAMRALTNDAALRASLAQSGLATVRARHTCAHRADQLLAIAAEMSPRLEGAA